MMKLNTKITLLEEMRANSLRCADAYEKEGNPVMAEELRNEAYGLYQAIKVLTNEEYAEDMAEIFLFDEEE